MSYEFKQLKYASGLKKKPTLKADPGIPLSINDFFLHLMFARLTAKTGDVYEFKTDFNEKTQQLELDIPKKYIDLITDLDIGDNMRQFLDWLVGDSVGGGGGAIDADIFQVQSSASLGVQTLSSLTVPANTLKLAGDGVYLRAWGTFGINSNAKTVQLCVGSTTVATNDVTVKPNGLAWILEAYVFKSNTSIQDVNGTALIGSVQQTPQVLTLAEDESADIQVAVKFQNGAAVAGDAIFRGLLIEAV